MATVKTVRRVVEAAQPQVVYVGNVASGIVVVDLSRRCPDYEENIEAARKALQAVGYATVIGPNGKLLVAGEASRTPRK